MQNYKFGVTGQDRKALVNAISEILGTEAVYLKTPTYAYAIGNINIDKNGTGTGEFSTELLEELAERGFQAEIEMPEETSEAEMPAEPEAEAQDEEHAPEAAEPTETATSGRLTIEYPLAGFSPEKLEILFKLVNSKAVLIKKAIGADDLPIGITENSIKFAWFPSDLDAETINAYSQFVAALCETAKVKTRVTAQPQATYDNEKFSMRIFGIQLGLKGLEYAFCRKLMMKNLTGDSGHRFGKPDGETAPRKRDGIQREVISIRLTPDTLEKLSILASQAETETGQRTSRNMLIEQAIEAYVAAEYANAAPTPEDETSIVEGVDEVHFAPETATDEVDTAQEETPADETPADTKPEAEGENVADTTADEGEEVGE